MDLNSIVGQAIHKMALIDSLEQRQVLKTKALAHTLSEWQNGTALKVVGVGFGTGLAGGPAGLLLEGFDIAYLLAAAGRACYGVGHIKGREIDYENDIPLILAIWCGAAEATSAVGTGKVGIKVFGKAGLKAAASVGSKIALKSATKFGTKGGLLIAGMATSHLAGKLLAKMSTKWIPVIGGVVGGGINYWIINGLLNAAERYYSEEYVVLSDDLAAAVTA